MSRIAFALLILSAPFAFAREGEDAAAKDLKLMQGAWTMAGLEVNGINVPAEKLEGTTLIIKGDLYTVQARGRETVCKFTLDPKQDPRHFDMVFQDGDKKDQLHKAIYRIEGDKLQIARGLNAGQPRPNQFATWPDTDYFVITWRRN